MLLLLLLLLFVVVVAVTVVKMWGPLVKLGVLVAELLHFGNVGPWSDANQISLSCAHYLLKVGWGAELQALGTSAHAPSHIQ